MTVINNQPYPAITTSEESSNEEMINYSNLSMRDLLQLQVYYLEKQVKEIEKFRESVEKRLKRIEEVLTNVGK